MKTLLDLAFVDYSVAILVDPIKLFYEATPELVIVFELHTDYATVVAFIYLVVVLADKSI